MIDYDQRTGEKHIITIEDPLEFVHEDKRCLINQREVAPTPSFKTALRAALREDPDIVLVGEMRDLETTGIAIETAETGHLVFGTLHTNTAASTVDRLIDQFPADRQPQIRAMLSESLQGVVAQTLLKKEGGGRVAAMEVLVVNTAVSNLIREGKTTRSPRSCRPASRACRRSTTPWWSWSRRARSSRKRHSVAILKRGARDVAPAVGNQRDMGRRLVLIPGKRRGSPRRTSRAWPIAFSRVCRQRT